MNNKRLLFLSMAALTLSIGVIIGTIISGGVEATFQEKPATIVIPDPVSLSNAFSQIAAQLEPAVVKIEVTAKARPVQQRRNPRNMPQLPPGFEDFFRQFGDVNPDPAPRGGTGTGFVVDKAGYILTNHHVVDGASTINVEFSDGAVLPAKVVGSDEGTDLGLIKVDAEHPLATAKFGNSEAVKVGDWVLAIGSPFGFDHTVTSGIISAKGRDNGQFGVKDSSRGLQRFLQTDAAINPGNSGGPLVNMAGEVIGINTAIVSGTDSFAGLGFALPSNTAAKVYNQLSQHGKVTRGSIGILMHTENNPVALEALSVKTREAVVVDQIYSGTPAAKAGLQANDVITEINGMKVANGDQLQDAIVDSPIGSTVKLGFLRGGRSQTVSVTIGDRADVVSDEPATSNARGELPLPRGGARNETTSRLGLSVQALTTQMSRQFNLLGVEVTKVDENSVADNAGLQEGMVITGYITGGRPTPITSIAEFRAFDMQLRTGMSLILQVKVPDAYERNLSFPMKVK